MRTRSHDLISDAEQKASTTMPPQPPFQRVVAAITAAIESGQYQPGDQLPSIMELAARYQVSRSTVQRAQGILKERGLIEGLSGVGVFVAE